MKQLSRRIQSTVVILLLLAGLFPITAGATTTTDNPNCETQTRILDVVAHQDDDLLFINPDIQKSINRGNCIETVYTTAGDAGKGKAYWSQREAGIHAAYAHMAGKRNIWLRQHVSFGQKTIVRDTLKNNPKIRVVFMRLPDGKIQGTGFASTGYKSLKKLWKGNVSYVRSVDDTSTYSKASLENMLANIMLGYQPNEIRTLNTNGSFGDGDHTDHVATAFFTKAAYKQANLSVPLYSYLGYPIKSKKVNLSDGQTASKRNTFFIYERKVDGICQTTRNCGWEYQKWLPRRYYNE